MKMSKLDRLGCSESVQLGFGCMRLPMKGDAIDREQALAMFDYAYQHGVNYYDTAWPYLGGTSEPFVGEALSRYPRDSFFLASKNAGLAGGIRSGFRADLRGTAGASF